tara:strand:- start:7910 stop:8764 length:855 start_codon:yes stop_codon:yes gene_type:complete
MATSRDDFGIAIRSALLQRGARQKFSLFVLILISIGVFALDTTDLKPIKFFRSILNDGIYRISAISSSPIKFSSATKDFFVEHMFIYKENEQLKSEIEQLRKEKFNSSYLETENKKLQEIVQLDKKSGYTTVGAKIMLDKNSPYLNSAIINKGTNSGIKLGMPVLSKGNLIGKIVEVNYISSRILLLNDLNSKIPVVISPSGDQAILSGIGKAKPSLEYLPEEFYPEENNAVYTSGKDGVLVPGISIGKALMEDNRIKVKLFSDPNQIYLVNVILGKETDSEAM